ncbi:MAG: hypothetical protein HGB12_16240 [Bacteroidetes bacterium]|nr:hypothetical protein [Bacteroidota bacterium]
MIFRIFQKREHFKPFYIGTCFVFDNEVKIYLIKTQRAKRNTTEILTEPIIGDEDFQLLTLRVNDILNTPKVLDEEGDDYLLKVNIIDVVRNYLGEGLNPDDFELRAKK